MIILSDCLTEKVDEGCLKIANNLTERIKSYDINTTVVSYDRTSEKSDLHLRLNKLFLNHSLLVLIRNKKESVLYIPFASNTKASAIRTWVLSLAASKGLKVIFALRYPMDRITRMILKKSNAEIIALSRESFDFYKKEIGKAVYLKTGIDTKRFIPVDTEKKAKLRRKYGVAEGKKVVLHVGHLKGGRNVDKLLNAGDHFHVFLVVSSATEREKDLLLRAKLDERPNITIIDSYIKYIEEIYQMADVYLFPVQEAENCIDVPLSVLEAAACNIPIVTTEYGELKEFRQEPGFYFINSLDENTLNRALNEMSEMRNCNNRQAVLEYDWDESVKHFLAESE